MILLDQLWHRASSNREEPRAEGAAIIKVLIDQSLCASVSSGPWAGGAGAGRSLLQTFKSPQSQQSNVYVNGYDNKSPLLVDYWHFS